MLCGLCCGLDVIGVAWGLCVLFGGYLGLCVFVGHDVLDLVVLFDVYYVIDSLWFILFGVVGLIDVVARSFGWCLVWFVFGILGGVVAGGLVLFGICRLYLFFCYILVGFVVCSNGLGVIACVCSGRLGWLVWWFMCWLGGCYMLCYILYIQLLL